MALTDKPPTNKSRGSCGIDKLGLTPAELEVLNGWLGPYSDQAVSDRLKEDGYHVGMQVVGKHRQRKCHCYR